MMKFPTFYFLAGAIFAIGTLKISEHPAFGLLLVGALATTIIGALFEVSNNEPSK